MDPTVTRFAPSPSGFLHIGNVRTALFSLLAALPDGRFLLRIEDTDVTRVSAVFSEAVLADLDWLGLGTFIDRESIWRQSERADVYAELFRALKEEDLCYPCFCSPQELDREREEARRLNRPPRYSGRCAQLSHEEAQARLAGGEPAAWRFRVPQNERVDFVDRVRGAQTVTTAVLGDFVIIRANGEPMFFFANAIDDALAGVTLVLRGEDHLSNTPRQVLLLRALGLRVPDYGHLPLVLDEAGTPLSKRAGAASVEDLRKEGFLPQAIVNYLARLGATIDCDHLADLPELAAAFTVEHIGRAPARFDRQQLLHWQRLALAALPEEDWEAFVPDNVPSEACAAFVRAVRPNVVFPAHELGRWAELIYENKTLAVSDEVRHAFSAVGRPFFDTALAALAAGATPSQIPGRLKAAGIGGKPLFHALRGALTGSLSGPEVKDLLVLMPPDIIKRRLTDSAGAVC